jgi:hypothetical protein
MSNMDYDKSEISHIPVMVSILISMLAIFIITITIVYFFKGTLKTQEISNEKKSSESFQLTQLNEWSENYLKSEKDGKVNIDDAIYITIRRNNP